MAVKWEAFPVEPLDVNCTIIWCTKTRESVIIDPGSGLDLVQEVIGRYSLNPVMVLLTHAHFDHCLGAGTLEKIYKTGKYGLHRLDFPLYQNINQQASLFGFPGQVSPVEISLDLADHETLQFGENIQLHLIHVPGHSPGSVCFYWENEGEKMLVSGDVVFAGSIGRTDLWGGDYDLLIRSIREKILTLDDKTVIIPGHGSLTTVHKEKIYNPFLSHLS